MVTITKEFTSTDIYETFYDLINANAMSVTYNTKTYTLQTLTSAYNEKMIMDKNSYPIVVINDANISTEKRTNSITESPISIDIDIFATSSKEARLFKDKIINTVDTNRAALTTDGIRNIEISITDSDAVKRGNFNSHFFTISFKFIIYQSRTGNGGPICP